MVLLQAGLLGIALGGSRSEIRNGFRPARVEGEEVFGAAVEFHAATGGFGDFLAEAHVVEAGWSSGARRSR